MKKVYAALLLLLSTVPALAQTADSNKNTKEGAIKLLDGTKEIKSFSANSTTSFVATSRSRGAR